MQNISKKIPLLISIILLGFFMFAFFFIYKQVNLNREKAEASVVEFENEVSNRNELRLLNNSIKTIKEESKMLSMHFAKSSDIVPFLDTIEGLAPSVGVRAETTSVDILEGNSGLMVTINTSGEFKDIYKFLILLENSPYELEFTRMEMEKEADAVTGEDGSVVVNSKWNAIFTIKLLSFVP